MTETTASETTTPTWTPVPGKVLVLRTADSNGRSYGGFLWPSEGAVSAPDWDPKNECGNGLHGLLWGAGAGNLLSWADDSRWLVVEVDEAAIVSLGQKVKYPSGVVIYSGTRDAAVNLIGDHAPDRSAVTGLSMAATGRYGIAAALGGGSATAGEDGVVIVRWTDRQDRPRVTVGYVGEDGVEAGVAYQCDASGKLIPAGDVPANKALTGDLISENKAFKVINLAAERAKRDAAKAPVQS